MALAHNQPQQPFLDSFDLSDVTLPTQSEIDPAIVEYVVDIDLDELIVFFGDKSTPYSYDESDDDYSLLINEESDRLIGIVVNSFLTQALKTHPELVPVLRHATIIADDTLNRPTTPDGENHALIEERKTIFTDFAKLVGIS